MFGRLVGHTSDRARPVAANNTPAANTAAVVTVAAVAGKTITLHGCQWSYSVSPTGGRLTVTSNGVSLFDVDVTSGGPGGFNFCIPGTHDQNLVVTLASGTGTCVGKLNVQYVIEP
jgi:hypothetical protein